MRMKHLLFFTLLCVLSSLKAQKTYVPDDNFETALIQYGYDSGPLDDSVLTSAIDTIIDLEISHREINNLMGIEDFTSLKYLGCVNNDLWSLYLSNNIYLETLRCDGNGMAMLNITNNSVLKELSCSNNNLTSLDVSNFQNLEALWCDVNFLTSIDVSNNPVLTSLTCTYNSLTNLNIANGNNTNMVKVETVYNPDLTCIQVDDINYSTINWVVYPFTFDDTALFGEDCNIPFSIEEERNLDKIKVFPVPTSSFIHITSKKQVSYVLYSILGKEMVMSGRITPDNYTIDLTHLNKGIYTLKIKSDKGIRTIRKIVKE